MNAPSIEDIVELSPLQQGMLFHALYEPASRLYFEQVVVPFDGHVMAAAFDQAWQCVAEADSALRTSFHWEESDKPVQVVHRKAVVPVVRRQLAAAASASQESELQALLAADRKQGFDLQRAPLLRVMLVQAPGSTNRLVLSFHHIILDGWSLQIVVRQFSQAYAALCAGRAPLLTPTRPYAEHVRWLRLGDAQRAQTYWRGVFAGCESGFRGLPDANLAVAEPQSREPDFDEVSFMLSAEATARLRESTSGRQLTLNTLIQGAWALLMQRLSGSDDVVFGITVSGRPAELPGVEQMVGLFINTVPLRVTVDHHATVADWLRHLQRSQFAAREYDHSPLVEVRQWSEVPGTAALFDTLLAFENFPVSTSGESEHTAVFVERTNYPLSAVVVPGPRLDVRLLYHRHRLERAAVEHIGAQFQRIIVALADGGDRRISELDLLTERDRALLAKINDTRRPYPADTTLAALWHERVLEDPDAPALVFGTRQLSRADLDREASALARHLSRQGVGRGTAVALLLERSIDFVVAVLAVTQAGGCYVPMDVGTPAARLREMLRDVAAATVICRREHATLVADAGATMLHMDRLPPHADMPPGRTTDAAVASCDAACVMYTSGSTGRPKGIVVPQRAVVRLVRNTDYVAISSADRIGHLSNVAFDAATFEIWGALLNGACIVGIDREAALSPSVLAHTLRMHEVTVLFITTALFNRIAVEMPDAFAPLRVVLFGGEAADPSAVRSILHAGPPRELCHVYGPTECTTFATWHRVSEVADDARTVPIGRPIANTTAWVVDANGVPLPPLAPGELVLGGDGVARGYQGQPRMTAERFMPDPFDGPEGERMYRTGDRVRWTLTGELEFLGRFDQQVKLRGHRIELSEIERCLTSHPSVAQAVAGPRQSAAGEPMLVAWFVPHPGAPSDLPAQLQQRLRDALPAYMQPAALQALDALPVNRNGKLDRAALPDPVVSRPVGATPPVAPRDDLERTLQALWSKILEIEQIGVHDDFFALGGHSLRATQLVSRVRRELDVELPLRQVFEHPTIAELADWVRAKTAVGKQPAAETSIPLAARRGTPVARAAAPSEPP